MIRRGYTDAEIESIFALGRLFLESGTFSRASVILKGLTEVAPEYAPGWLALGYIAIMNGEYEQALGHSNQVLRRNPANPEAMLMNVICSLSTGDINSAGTYLGELKDGIDGEQINNPQLVRLYQSQLVRFQSR
jgi:tetratricopeptide (TPR) repeat protein